jgi:short-subunit dehydrogenase
MASQGRKQRVVIVTGASSGIGAAATRAFAAEGAHLTLVARRADRLESLRRELEAAGTEVQVVALDLALPESADELVRAALDRWSRVDVLVNNAGFGKQSAFEEMTNDAVAAMFQVNVLAAMAAARAVVPVMRKQGSGSIVNVASVGGVVAHPLNVAYCASKHALVGFSKAVGLGLAGTGIGVTAVCPGATRTEFFDVARGPIPFDAMIDRWSVPAEVVADTIVKASAGHRELVFPTLSAWFLYWADRWLPWASRAGNLRYRDTVLARAARR